MAGVSPAVLRTIAADTAAATAKLPAGFRHARDQSLGGELAKGQPRDFESPNEGAAAARYLTTVHHSSRAGVAGKLGQAGIVFFRFELGPHRGVFLHRIALPFIAINPGRLCHKERAI